MRNKTVASFFSPDNVIALGLALLIIVLLLRIWLESKGYFKHNQANVVPFIIIAIIFLLLYPAVLRIASFTFPFLALIGIALMFLMFFAYSAMGMDNKGITGILRLPSVKFVLKICVVVIVAIAAGMVFGEQLLQEKSISFSEGVFPAQQEEKGMDFSFLFTSQALGLLFVLSVVGIAFFYVSR
ncbi:hypothetical protein HZB03_00325 [Candidatus Woesearchaeota archaeon]|nr:hypothetical protein [Candidatus Woesearchaeota archaeon]